MYDSEKEYQMMFERLKDICKQRKITNYALAKATNLSNSSISNLMNGKTTPYVDTLLRICSALDTPRTAGVRLSASSEIDADGANATPFQRSKFVGMVLPCYCF